MMLIANSFLICWLWDVDSA